MKAIDAATDLLGSRILDWDNLFAGSLMDCSRPVTEDMVAARLMEVLWEEANHWLCDWQHQTENIKVVRAHAHLWLCERTVKCRWKVARAMARRLLREAAAGGDE